MPTDNGRVRVKAATMLFLATIVWGASFPAMKALGLIQRQLLPDVGTWFVTSLSLLVRFGVSALLIGLWNWRQIRRVTRAEMWQGVGLGCFGGLGILFQMDGVQHTAASTSAFLTQCYCILIPVTLALHGRRIPEKNLIVGTIMVLAGMAVLSNIDWRQLRIGRGEAESIAGSILFTGQILWLERPMFKENRIGPSTFVMFAVTTVVVLPAVVLTATSSRELIVAYNSWPALATISLLTLGGTLATYTTMNYWQPHLPATQAGLIYCCEPLFASVFVLFVPGLLSGAFGIHYPNEALTGRLLVGGGLITAANVVSMWPTLRATPPP